MLAYQAIPELLRRAKVDVVFSMLGGTNVAWVGHGVASGAFRLITTRHEEVALQAATGYSLSTGRLGVCTVTRGPGFANAFNSLVSATKVGVPILLVVAESPLLDVWNEQATLDQRAIASTIGSGFHHAEHAGNLEGVFWQAVTDAVRRAQPQVLSIGTGVVSSHTLRDVDVTLTRTDTDIHTKTSPDAESVCAAVDVLETAQQPLILAGRGAVLATCREQLEELGSMVGARLATTLRANSFFAGHELDLGLCGVWSPPAVRDILSRSDAVVAFGASLNDKTTDHGALFGGAKVIHCEVDEHRESKASAPELGLLGDAKQTAMALIREWRRRGLPKREVNATTPSIDNSRLSVLSVDLDHDPSRGLDLRNVCTAFDEKLPDNRIVVTDSGSTKALLSVLVGAQDANSWLMGRGWGSVGLGLGTAIGAAVAHPERPVALFCGDGGFMMGLSALDTVRTSNLNLTVIILNDEQLGSEIKHLTRDNLSLPLDIVRNDLPTIEILAEAYGGHGRTIQTPKELSDLELSGGGLEIIDVRIDPEIRWDAVLS